MRKAWSPIGSLVAFAAAFCVFGVLFGLVFFVAGGFLLVVFQKYAVFAVVVSVPAFACACFAAVVAAFPVGWPSPIGELGARRVDDPRAIAPPPVTSRSH
jgi:hypothetical protein